MATRVLGPTGSRRRRRISLLVPLIAALAMVVPGLTLGVGQPPSPPPVNNPNFEFDAGDIGVNGILTDDADTDGVLDWDDTNQDGTDRPGDPVIEATRNPDGTCNQTNGPATAGGPGVIGAGLLVCDGSQGNFDDRDAFTNGSKNEGTNWFIDNIGSPKKADLAELMIYAKFGDSDSDADLNPDDLFLFTGAMRLDKNGDTHIDVELNQQNVKRNCPDSEPGTPGYQTSNCVVQRTNGDVLIAIDLAQGGAAPNLRVFQFKTTLGPGETCENAPQVSPPCLVHLAGAGNAAVGAVNDAQGQIQGPNWNAVGCDPTPPDDPTTGCKIRDDVVQRGFMETFTDLSKFGVDVTCPGFSNVIFKTRSSDSLNSSLQDDAEATINIAECSLAWEKRDDLGALQGGATFTVGTAGGTNGDGNGPFACLDSNNTGADDDNPLTVADNGANDADSDAGQLLMSNICFGTYIVTETVSPTGFALDDDVTRAVTVSAADANAVIGTQGQDDPGNTDESDFHNRLGSIAWEKRDDQGVLQGGATFEVSGTPGPLACRGIAGTITVADNGPNDANPVAGQYMLDRVCLGTYTVTETIAPPGFALPADPDREVTVSAANLNVSIGTIGNDDVDDFHNRLGSIAWEKRDDQGALQGGATFTVGGATTGPFACQDADSIGPDDDNPVTVVDDTDGVTSATDVDKDPDPGQFRLERVCLGTYTITETVAPPGFALDDDVDRSITVSSSELNPVVGTQGQDDPGNTDESDFHNRLGSIAWEKRDDQGVLQGGATFEVSGTPGPLACRGIAGTITVADNGPNDANPVAGQYKLDRVCLGTYTVTETIAPPGFALDDDPTRSVTVSASDLDAVIGTQGEDDLGNTDESDFHNRLGSLSWEKRDDVGVLQGGATFTVGTAGGSNGDGNGPFACQDADSIGPDDDNPVTVTDNSPPDVDVDAGQLHLNRVCLGTYTITETISPPGFALDDDVTREVTVSSTELNPTVGIQGQDDPGNTDESDFHNRLGTIEWEKRDASVSQPHPLQGGATFEVSGNGGPLACHGTSGTITVVDNGANDADPDAGQLKLDRVCLGSYTITETVAPPDFLFDTDTTRTVSVSSGDLTGTVGTEPLGDPPGTDDEGTRVNGECTDNACDFHNRRGSLLIRKEGKDASTLDPTDLLGGASFLITPNPLTGIGTLVVTDNDPNDGYAADGLICLNNVVPGTYNVLESNAPSGYKGESASKTAVSSTQSCTGRQAPIPDDQTADVTFDNIPLSTIQVIFDSLADGKLGDATVASIACTDSGGTIPANAENGNPDPARDDTNETYGNGTTTLEPGVYTCTIDIDP